MVLEVLRLLEPKDGERVLDLTVGTGSHAMSLGQQVGVDGFLVGLDADAHALRVAEERLRDALPCPFRLVHRAFSQAPEVARELGIEAFDVVLADLGLGTHQLDDPARGFALASEHRLDMRYDTSRGMSAWDVINRLSEAELADVFYTLGEERFSRQIASAICRERERGPIETPAQLADIAKRVVGRRTKGRHLRLHPATRIMMATRIYVNDEVAELQRLLDALPGLLAPGGRAAILTYHSLEARPVKNTWREQEKQGLLERIVRSPLKPSDEEVRDNPRARSAQLRAVRKQ